MTKETMLAYAGPLLEAALQKGSRVQVKGVDLTGPGDIPAAVERCWHDCLSDLDVEVWGAPAAELIGGMQLLGATVQGNVLRLVTVEGFRADIICHGASADLAGAEFFWFVAVQALGKLLRRDYLIAAHLAHMLLMETLVTQMVQRDEAHHTNYHRYGYGERLDYRAADIAPFADLLAGDETHAHIAEMLIRAALCREHPQPFLAIWRAYLKELES